MRRSKECGYRIKGGREVTDGERYLIGIVFEYEAEPIESDDSTSDQYDSPWKEFIDYYIKKRA